MWTGKPIGKATWEYSASLKVWISQDIPFSSVYHRKTFTFVENAICYKGHISFMALSFVTVKRKLTQQPSVTLLKLWHNYAAEFHTVVKRYYTYQQGLTSGRNVKEICKLK